MNKIGNSWDEILKKEFSAPYFSALNDKIEEEYKTQTVFPPYELIFRALSMVDYNDVKVVILGQDPYHGDGQANGIAFAVNKGIPLPPSLINIYKEIESDIGVKMPTTGTLLGWEEQGVLLLNATLTVRKATPQSHSALGWQRFTDAVTTALSAREKPMVFILWGAGAGSKKSLIAARHKILMSPHPSPLSASRGFFGCKHFSQTNEFLAEHGMAPIDWANVDGGLASYYGGKITRV
ncbi:uracil-DNA glycosylase [Pumilibacter muris]|uniref:uracil-DNA glycosylase n=1 Tax=Pumilibacter muris TaxID=2941510 RepID=UPI002042025B|nr:uracil-DNA glycosylase [Pumilibacter muris]